MVLGPNGGGDLSCDGPLVQLVLLEGQCEGVDAALGRECCDPRDFLQVKLESDPKEGPDDEAIEVYGRADHWGFARAGGGRFDRGHLPQAWDQQRDLLWLEGEVRWAGGL
jgi:hypothetical protein